MIVIKIVTNVHRVDWHFCELRFWGFRPLGLISVWVIWNHRVDCCVLVSYNFKSVVYNLREAILIHFNYDKDKKSCFDIRMKWVVPESHLLSSSGAKHPCCGRFNKKHEEATIARGHLDYKYPEFMRTIREC